MPSTFRWLPLLVLLGGCQAAPPPPPLPYVPQAHFRANASVEVMLTGFWSGRQNYFEREVPPLGIPTAYWHYAHAYEALLDGVERAQGLRFAGWPERFFDSQDALTWSSILYDDENWMALALLRSYDITQDSRMLEEARALTEHILSAWDTTCCGARPGGIWWDQAKTSKATVSNAGPVITLVRLYERTQEPRYLESARKVYAYWREEMVVPETGQVLDHVELSGEKVGWKFTYNEGVMMGAAVELHRATGDAAYLAHAHQHAAWMLTTFTHATALGPVLSDGSPESCTIDCPLFKGIAYRYLQQLQEVDPRPEYAAALSATAESLWTRARDDATGLFGIEWAGSSPQGSTLAQHASAAMALNVVALPEPGEVRTAGAWRYEAEEAYVRAISLQRAESADGEQQGFGFVRGIGRQGELVRFDVEVPRAGRYLLRLRYRAARDAQRTLSTLGSSLRLELPATGDGWGEVELGWELGAGRTPLELTFGEGPPGQFGFDIDALELEEPREADCSADASTLWAPRWVNLSPGDVLCGPKLLCWRADASTEESELVVDGTSVCRTQSSCCPVPKLAGGWHHAYVVGRGKCGARAGRPVSFAWAPPLPQPAPTVDAQGVRWASVDGADGYDVFVGDARVCAGVRRPACHFAPSGRPEGAVHVVPRPVSSGACTWR